MEKIDFSKHSNKKPVNDLPFPEDQHLASFFVHGYDEVRAMDYNRDNLETWHFSSVPVLVGFIPVAKEQSTVRSSFSGRMSAITSKSLPAIPT